jgi:hypothetical protein
MTLAPSLGDSILHLLSPFPFSPRSRLTFVDDAVDAAVDSIDDADDSSYSPFLTDYSCCFLLSPPGSIGDFDAAVELTDAVESL